VDVAPIQILVVDDDPSILRLIATILRREKYQVDTACGGREGLAKIEASSYDVIVLDLMMPEVSGLDVLAVLETRVPKVKRVVILSAASSLAVTDSFRSNVFVSLRKPFDNSALIDAVRRCIDGNCGDPSIPAAA
jgi:DNA-binding NtrC family response regulator